MSRDFDDEQIDSIKMLFNSRLSTKIDVVNLCSSIGLSVPTMYRYKKEPENIPYGVYLKIKRYFNQLENAPDFILPSPNDFIIAEERRLSFEQACSSGERYVVTPVFTVTCETEDFTRAITEIDYPDISNSLLEKFLKIRQNRRREYEKGTYFSNELINAAVYRDFYLGVNRFSSIQRKCIEMQIEHLISTMALKNVNRRIYLYCTPELPTISCYKVKTRKKEILKCIIRADDFVTEYTDEKHHSHATELLKAFQKYFEWPTNIIDRDEVIKFLRNPMLFPLF